LALANLTLDGNLLDIGGLSNHGNVTGTTTYTAGPKVRQAFDFDGSTYITLENENNFDIEYTDAFTATGWFKSSNTAQSTMVAKMVNSGTYRGWDVALNNAVDDGKIGFQIISDVTTNNWINWWSTGGGLNDGLWHHFACVYTGATGNESDITVYIDGVSEAGDAAAPLEDITATMLQDTAITIGSRSVGQLPYTGQLADVQIWKKELTATEVLRLVNEPQLAASLTLDGVLTDSVGDNDGTVTGATGYTSGPKNAQSFDFDGSSYISLANPTDFDFIEMDRPWSFSLWMQTTASSGSEMVLTRGAVSVGSGFELWRWNTNGFLTFSFTNTTTNHNVEVSGDTINDGVWHHIAYTFSGNSNRNGLKVYFDGIQTGTGAAQALTTLVEADPVRIGADESGNNDANNLTNMSEVQIWQGELSAEEVKNIYNTNSLNIQYDIPTVGAVRLTPKRSTFDYNRKLSLNMK
jgi:hypothetical protein